MWSSLLVMGIYLTTASLVFLQHPFFRSLFRQDGEMIYEGHDIYFMIRVLLLLCAQRNAQRL